MCQLRARGSSVVCTRQWCWPGLLSIPGSAAWRWAMMRQLFCSAGAPPCRWRAGPGARHWPLCPASPFLRSWAAFRPFQSPGRPRLSVLLCMLT